MQIILNQKPPFDYTRLFNNILITLIALLIITIWLNLSSKRDNQRNTKYNTCMSSYTDNALPLAQYLKDCMN